MPKVPPIPYKSPSKKGHGDSLRKYRMDTKHFNSKYQDNSTQKYMGTRAHTPRRNYQGSDYNKYKNAAIASSRRSAGGGKYNFGEPKSPKRIQSSRYAYHNRAKTLDGLDEFSKPHERLSVEKMIERAKNREKEVSLLKIQRKNRERRLKALDENSINTERTSLTSEFTIL